MEPRLTDRAHRHYQELLGAYALGLATPAEAPVVAKHLADCPACRAEIAELRGAVLALPIAVAEQEPPPPLRSRILAAVEQERMAERWGTARPPADTLPRPLPTMPSARSVERRTRGGWLPWAAATALFLVALGLLGWNLQLREPTDSGVRTVALQPTHADVRATGEVRYLADPGVLLLSLRDAPDLPDDRVYQVWLIAGETPVSAGIVPAQTDTLAIAADPAEFDLLAITVEPGPMGVPAPTSAPILTATLGSG